MATLIENKTVNWYQTHLILSYCFAAAPLPYQPRNRAYRKSFPAVKQ